MSRAPVLTLAMIILALLLAAPHASTQAQNQVEVKIRWVTYINPTKFFDAAHGTCVLGDYIAVVGYVEKVRYVHNPYVALLRKSDGSVVREWIGSEEGGFANCISVGEKLYAIGFAEINDVGYGLIYVFDVNLNVLESVRDERESFYFSLAYDGRALYIGGIAFEFVGGFNVVGLIEKRDPDTLSLIASRRIGYGPLRAGVIYDVGVEPSTGRVWAVGSYGDHNRITYSLIVIFDNDLREIKVIDYPLFSEGYLGGLHGIAFDDGQYAYVSGERGVAKFTVDGELVAVNRDGKERVKIVYGYGYVYTFSHYKHILYIHDANLNMVKEYVLNENVTVTSYLLNGRPALEGGNIYVAGYDCIEDCRIVVYSLSLEGITVTTATSAKGAVAATTTAETATAAIAATTTTTIPVTRAVTVIVIGGLVAVGVMLTIVALLLRRR